MSINTTVEIIRNASSLEKDVTIGSASGWRTFHYHYCNIIACPLISFETVVAMNSAQIGKTEILNNVIRYFAEDDPSPVLVVEPTIGVEKEYSKDRVSSMIRDTPCLTGRDREARTRHSDNTTLHKKFKGGHITIAGANAAASLRPGRSSVRHGWRNDI